MLDTRDPRAARIVVGTGVALVVAQLAFRAWVIVPSWFLLDDYDLLYDAHGRSPSPAYLFEPQDGRLIPGGRLLAWLVARAGPVDWGAAAAVSLTLQALAGLACLWMLVTLFGPRRAVLAPLALYLTSALTLPAFVQWSAAIEQLPLQAALFGAVTTWVRFQRGRRARWSLATLLLVVSGLLCSGGAVLLVPLLAYLTATYFASGGLRRRAVTVLRREWPPLTVGALLLAGSLAVHLRLRDTRGPGSVSPRLVGQVADTLLGTSFGSGVLGGPWRWASPGTPPSQVAAPPDWALHLAWLVLGVVVVWGALRRRRTLRGWAPLPACLVAMVAVLSSTGASVFGPATGSDYRYLTPAAAVATLCLGLAFLPLRGAGDQSSSARPDPLLRVPVPPAAVALLVTVVSVSGLLSSVAYTRYWHGHNASDAFVHRLGAELGAQGAVDLVDQTLPTDVVPPLAAPANTVRRMAAVLGGRARFPVTTSRLGIVAPDGSLRTAVIQQGLASRPGPRADCGWPVSGAGRSIPLTGRAFDYDWWLRIGYLSPRSSRLEVSAGSTRVVAQVDPGLHSLFVHVRGSFDQVTVGRLDPGVRICVDTVEVGTPAPGGYLL